MTVARIAGKISCWAAVLPFVIRGPAAETPILALSSATADSHGTATLELSLRSSDDQPVALQWTFQCSRSEISSISIDDGPILESSGKTVLCTGDAAAYKCLVVGANAKPIPNGVVAKVTVTLVSGIRRTTIRLRDALGTSASGKEIPIAEVTGIVTTSKAPRIKTHASTMGNESQNYERTSDAF